MSSDAQFHISETARAARAAHARMMRGDMPTMYVYYKTRRIEAFVDGECPTGEGWQLAWAERVPGSMTADQLGYWFKSRADRLPYLY
jgi:hypothetical protein